MDGRPQPVGPRGHRESAEHKPRVPGFPQLARAERADHPPARSAAAQLHAASRVLRRAQAEANGHLVAVLAPPLARDARGRSVSTKLRLRHDTVTLVVEHRRRDVTYPVIADPDLIDCAGVSPCGRFDHRAAAAYAVKWALRRNPSYDRFDNDCTNFVSQALRAGGMRQRREYQRGDGSWWSKKVFGPGFPPRLSLHHFRTTASWRLVAVMYRQLLRLRLAHWNANNTWAHPRAGDLVFYWWRGTAPRDEPDHVAMITRRRITRFDRRWGLHDYDAFLTQHTRDYANRSMDRSIRPQLNRDLKDWTLQVIRPTRTATNLR